MGKSHKERIFHVVFCVFLLISKNISWFLPFAKILAGVLPADCRDKQLDASVGYMPQKNYAFRMSTRANILLGNPDTGKAEALMDSLQLRPLEKKRADRLSGGETARMALARLMMKRFDLVILDEPTAAMDMESTLISEECIRQYVHENNCALILVTHSLQQARRLADCILYFHKGKLAEYGPIEQLLEHPTTKEAQSFMDFFGVSN